MKRLLIVFFVVCSQLYGMNSIIEIDHMEELPKHLDELPAEETLLLFDIDKTIGFLKSRTGDQVENFELVESVTPEIIKEAQRKFKCCALTSRSKISHHLTKAQLSKYGIDFSTSSPFMKYDKDSILVHIGHRDGIIYVGTAEKGRVSIIYLKNAKVKNALCIEDQLDNLLEMNVKIPESNINFQGILYTHYEKMKLKKKELESQQVTTSNNNSQGMENL